MRKTVIAALAGALLASSVSAAAAWDERHDDYYRDGHGPGPVLGFAGDVLAGAVRIATLPLTLLADIGRDGWRHDGYSDGYYDGPSGAYAVSPQEAHAYYGAGATYYGPPPRLYALDER